MRFRSQIRKVALQRCISTTKCWLPLLMIPGHHSTNMERTDEVPLAECLQCDHHQLRHRLQHHPPGQNSAPPSGHTYVHTYTCADMHAYIHTYTAINCSVL